MESNTPSWLVAILVGLAVGGLSGIGGGLFAWWRGSLADKARNEERDRAQARELEHFRAETDLLFTKMETVMNGFGGRLDTITDQVHKQEYTLHGPKGQNGVYGSVRELMATAAALTAKVDMTLQQVVGLGDRVGANTAKLVEVERRLPRPG